DELRDLVAVLEDVREVAGPRIRLLRGLGNGRRDVPQIRDFELELRRQLIGETGVPDGRWAHVDAAAALPEVERGAEHGDLLHGHGDKANVGPVSQLRVLLADDDAGYIESLKPLIESQPELTVVGWAENGLHAIELADELHPDAVVIDLHMPLLDGVTAVARLRKDHPPLCLIALNSDTDTR